ncbi:AtpZ/AtpI family protein [Candidatus Uhrbacteria bacterium]|nr:AtpZ/AtpI family protein [Candidatus Uhrbacteria bacterium]
MASDVRYYRLAMRIFADFSGSIAIPAVLAALLGKWLDEKYGTEPRYLIMLLAIALILTSVILVRKAKKYLAEYEKLMK